MEYLIGLAIILLTGLVYWYLKKDKTVEQIDVQTTHDSASKSAIIANESTVEATHSYPGAPYKLPHLPVPPRSQSTGIPNPPPPPPMRNPATGREHPLPNYPRSPSANPNFGAPYGTSQNSGISLTDVVVGALVLDALTPDEPKAAPAPVETPREPEPTPSYVEPETTRYEPPESTSYGGDSSSSSWSSNDSSSSSNDSSTSNSDW